MNVYRKFKCQYFHHYTSNDDRHLCRKIIYLVIYLAFLGTPHETIYLLVVHFHVNSPNYVFTKHHNDNSPQPHILLTLKCI